MIYIDTSVALAHVLVEGRRPTESFWQQSLVASRLLEYELWTVLHARRLGSLHVEEVHALVAKVDLWELTPAVLARALEPFPIAVRTLDALHLATIEYLRGRRSTVELASYDERLVAGARALGIGVYEL